MLGIIAFMRQGLIDAEWYDKSQKILTKYPDNNEPIHKDRSLATIANALNQKQRFIFRINKF